MSEEQEAVDDVFDKRALYTLPCGHPRACLGFGIECGWCADRVGLGEALEALRPFAQFDWPHEGYTRYAIKHTAIEEAKRVHEKYETKDQSTGGQGEEEGV